MRKTFCKFVIVLTAFFALATLSAMAQPWWTATANWNGAPGSITDNGDGTATMTAGGNEIWNNNDVGFFAYAPVTGNFDASMWTPSETIPTATTYGNGAWWARMGFMARVTGSDPRSAYVMMTHSPLGSINPADNSNWGADQFGTQWKANYDGGSGNQGAWGYVEWPNHWFRMARRGNTFYPYAHESLDSWINGEPIWAHVRPLDPVGLLGASANFPATIDFGVAGCSHNNINAATIVTTKIQNYTLVQGQDPILTDKRPVHFNKFIASDYYPTWDNLNAMRDRLNAGSRYIEEMPDSIKTPLANFEDFNSNNGGYRDADSIVEQIWGVFVAPAEADYTFYLSSDDGSELLISNDDQPASRHVIASRAGWCAYRAYPADSVAAPIHLLAGEKRYLEVRMQQGGGGGHVEVAVASSDGAYTVTPSVDPNTAGTTPGIPAALFASSTYYNRHIWMTEGDIFITQQPAPVVINAGLNYTFSGKIDGTPPWTVQWQRSDDAGANWFNVGGDSWSYTAKADYTLDDQAMFRFVATGPNNTVTSDPVTLTVLPVPFVVNVIWPGVGSPYLYVVYNVPVDGTGVDPNNYTFAGTVTGPINVLDATYNDTYAQNGSGSAVQLTLEGTLNYTENFDLTITGVYDGITGSYLINPDPTIWHLSMSPQAGQVLHHKFNNIGGTDITANLFTSAPYLNNAPISAIFRNTINSPGMDDNYGVRVSGWITPSTEGDYLFRIQGDDECRFLMSTSEDPAGLRRIVGYPPGACCGNGYVSSDPVQGIGGTVHLLANQPYYFEAFVKEGGGGDSLNVFWSSDGSEPTIVIPAANLSYAILPNLQLHFGLQPDGVSFENAPKRLTATVVSTEPGAVYQWRKNGVNIPGATGVLPGVSAGAAAGSAVATVSYNIPGVQTSANAGDTYDCVVTSKVNVPAGWAGAGDGIVPLQAVSDPAVISLIPDPVAPTIVSAGSLDGMQVGIAFDKYVDAASALNPASYTFNGASLVTGGVVVQAIPTTKVWLTLYSPIPSGTLLQATVKNGSGVEGVSSTTVTPEYITEGDIGYPNNPLGGHSYCFAPGEVDAYGGGDDIWGWDVRAHSDGRYIQGNFDVKVRMNSLSQPAASGGWSKAGLMARNGTSPSAQNLIIMIAPPAGGNRIQAYWLPTPAGATDWGNTVGPNVNTMLPNLWLRLARTGNTLTSYYGTDGINWSTHTAYTSDHLPELLLVGPIITGHNNSELAKGEFRNLYMPSTLPHDIVVTAPTVAACSGTADFTVAAVNPANSGPLWYQWKKNGVNVAGANAATLTIDLGVDPSAIGAAYTVMVGNDGGGVLSAPAYASILAVANIVPTTTGVFVKYSANYGAEALVADRYVFAGRGISAGANALSVAAVSPTVVFVTALDAIDPYLPAGLADSYTLTLTGAGTCPNPVTLPFTGVGQGYISADFTGNVIPSYAFTPSDLPDGANRHAYAENDYLVLTKNVNDQRGIILFDEMNAEQPVGAFSAEFDVAAFSTGADPADGWSFNFGPNPRAFPNWNAEFGDPWVFNGSVSGQLQPKGFSVCFEIYPPNNPGIKLKWNGAQFAEVLMQTWRNSATPVWDHVAMALGPDGKFSLSWAGQVIFNQVQTPCTPTRGQFNIAARTGGLNLNMWVDNIKISTVVAGGPPAILAQPANTVIQPGQTAALYAPFSGTTPAFGQWYSNDVAIAGANSPLYVTAPITCAGTGGSATYKFQVSNAYGSATSGNAVVSLAVDPTIPTITSVVPGSYGYAPDKLTVNFNKALNSAELLVSGNYSIMDALNNPVTILAVSPKSGTSVDIKTVPMTPGTVGTLTVNLHDNECPVPNAVTPNSAQFTTWEVTYGIRVDYYFDLGTGWNPDQVTTSAKYLGNEPDLVQYVNKFAVNADPGGWGYYDIYNYYGAKISGFFYPPETGDYVFYIASDDFSKLLINPTGTDPTGAFEVARVGAPYLRPDGAGANCCQAYGNLNMGVRTDGSASSVSAPIHLEAGVAVYLEGVFKEEGGGDGMRVTYTLAGAPVPTNPSDILSAAYFKIAVPASTLPVLPTGGRLDIGALTERGFDGRQSQPAMAPGDPNTTANTELMLAMSGIYATDASKAKWPCFIEPGIINYNHANYDLPNGIGNIVGPANPDKAFPGYFRSEYFDNFALEMIGYVELQAGHYRWGVNSDDGFRVMCQVGPAAFGDATGVVMGEFSGGRGGAGVGTPFDFVVPQAGLYPIRLTFEEGTGGNNVEFWNWDLASGAYSPINDPLGIAVYRPLLNTIPADPAAPTLAISKEVVNSYNGTIAGDGGIYGEYAFVNESAGYATPTFLTSTVNLGTFADTDTIELELYAGWDWNTVGAVPNWQVQSGSVTVGGGAATVPVDFTTSDNGFTVINSTPAPTGAWTWSAGSGWAANGEPGFAAQLPSWSALRSPPLPVGVPGPVSLSLNHRWSFEGGAYDGGQLRVSVNGGPFTPVPVSAFTGDLLAGGRLIVSWNGDLPCMQSWLLQGKTDLGTTGWTSIGFMKAGANGSYIVPAGLPYQFFRVVSVNNIAAGL